MTASRLGRVSKGRVFIYVVCILFLVALIACYKNASSLLEKAQESYERCRQEQENTSQQLHVVFDYKQRLEKTLQSEKAEYLHTKSEFTNKLNEEKMKCDKINNDAKLRFSTLQQHYNLLQTQLDDLKEDGGKIQRNQLDSINQLQAKLKEVQEELKRTVSDKENSIQHIQAQRNALEQENSSLKEKIMKLLNNKQIPVQRTEFSSTQFNKVIPVGNDQYVIPEETRNERNENVAVLPPPSEMKIPERVYTPKTSPKAEGLNAAFPLNAPSATPDSSKSSTTKKTLPIPLPYQAAVPLGVVQAPILNIPDESKDKELLGKNMIDERFKNVGDKPEEAAGYKGNGDIGVESNADLKKQFNIQADNEDGAQEVFDLPIHNNVEKDLVAKKHKENNALNANNNDVDYEGQNQLDEVDDGEDDAADGGNPNGHQDEAIRN